MIFNDLHICGILANISQPITQLYGWTIMQESQH